MFSTKNNPINACHTAIHTLKIQKGYPLKRAAFCKLKQEKSLIQQYLVAHQQSPFPAAVNKCRLSVGACLHQ
jgi:hypothetical protein